MDNQDKTAWCRAGEKAEADFLATRQITGVGLSRNPAKQADPYAHDYIAVVPVDLNTMRTPWRKSQELFGIPTEKAVSINQKDLRRYSELYPNIIIYLDVEYSGKLFSLTLDRARRLIETGRAHRHEYLERKDDAAGNAKVSFIFNTDDLDAVREMVTSAN